jgi:cytochrome c biogenesis protein CcdA
VIGAFFLGVFYLIAGIVAIPFYLLGMLARVMEKFVNWFNRWSGAGY